MPTLFSVDLDVTGVDDLGMATDLSSRLREAPEGESISESTILDYLDHQTAGGPIDKYVECYTATVAGLPFVGGVPEWRIFAEFDLDRNVSYSAKAMTNGPTGAALFEFVALEATAV